MQEMALRAGRYIHISVYICTYTTHGRIDTYIHTYGMFTNPTEIWTMWNTKVNTDNKLILIESSFLGRASCIG